MKDCPSQEGRFQSAGGKFPVSRGNAPLQTGECGASRGNIPSKSGQIRPNPAKSGQIRPNPGRLDLRKGSLTLLMTATHLVRGGKQYQVDVPERSATAINLPALAK